MNYVNHLLHRIFTTDYLLIKFVIAVWIFFSGIHLYLFCITGLITMDVITGILSSVKQGKNFTSEYLRKGLLEKTALYLILILSAFALEIVFKSIYPYDHYFIVFFVTVLISSYECVSIMENILIINPSLTFINPLIRLSKRISKATEKSADDKIDIVEEISKDS